MNDRTTGPNTVLGTRQIGRRRFLQGGAAVAIGALAVPAGLQGLVARNNVSAASPGYGPLSPKPDLRDGVQRISLPDGFQYRSFGVAGTPMTDGNLTPLAHDGMAAYVMPNGQVRLVRNHEDRNLPGAGSTAGPVATKYDALGGGGTTTLVINPVTRMKVSDFVSLNGTIVNCAGGATPWNSWITCEETTEGTDQGWARDHGYCFDVPAGANAAVPATPLKAMGRFSHEAVAVDAKTLTVYETEDNGGNSGFYRFLANVPGNLFQGGRLQMLAVAGAANYDTRTGQTVGKKLPVTWVDIALPDFESPDDNDTFVFLQGWALGGARFARLEGCWYEDGSIYFNSTNGGNVSRGQVWQYTPQGNAGGSLALVFESPSQAVLDLPDNITVSPRGGLLLCEDGGGDNFLRGITKQGEIFDFARNNQSPFSEWAGATFVKGGNVPQGANDGSDQTTLFVNRQGITGGVNPPLTDPGMTFAIWGPWNSGPL